MLFLDPPSHLEHPRQEDVSLCHLVGLHLVTTLSTLANVPYLGEYYNILIKAILTRIINNNEYLKTERVIVKLTYPHQHAKNKHCTVLYIKR